ncbi:helix-turn-helix domain-containing protein [Paenibacillus sp. P2(2022)]|uniref:helix-turn-helix domain-containing protein n=1 Tax=Paenibacillus TaxID=44249 RepID=UPI001C9DCC80|nr:MULTISPECIES: helix-turn-helix domain-containing protein [Paenibacillus]MBY7736758.1 helix-turn-helix domain-containing protein [Paenibacillus polymyxa]MCV9949297.1 helix-turn-helix domain-containing protein [Paenibacillus sp. BT-177]MDG0053420.1 helix-turn-helix domain-containing protein [Paenibacillus sp. P2(2022)]MEE4566280.1 helix-turn-helix domain-containing protein [Paenibacillus polymyxa]
MLKVEFDTDQLKSIIDAAVSKAMKQYTPNQLPSLMTKKQLMEFLGIGSTKASELLNREDFPVIREFGHPRVPLHALMVWINEHTEWIRDNAKDYWERTGSVA